MTQAAELIRQLEAEGCLADAGNGILNIRQGSRLSRETVEAVKQQKEAILTILEQDRQAQSAGLNVALYGEMYWLSVTPKAALYMERTGDPASEWSLRRENDKAMYQKHNVMATGNFDDVVKRAANYIQFLKRKQVV